MLVALIGAHGVGKTTTANAIMRRLEHNNFSLFKEYFRRAVIELGYQSPREAVMEEEQVKHVTSSILCGSALAVELEWCQQLKTHGVIDMGPASVLAYARYWLDYCNEPMPPYLMRLGAKVSDLIDYFIYLPVGAIPLVADPMRSNDRDFQRIIDQQVQTLIKTLQIPDHKVLFIQSVDINKRVEEILRFIQR